jgi:hypothetical protein
MLKRISRRFGVAASVALFVGLVAIAPVDKADNDSGALVHVGSNPGSCGTTPGADSGMVDVHFNADRNRFKVNVSVHDALPRTTYVVDIRCVGQIGSLTTNSRGTGRVQIDLSRSAPPSDGFFIDISVYNGVTYGDTFIAGPFVLN